jgi:competence protein ComEA
MVDPGRAKLAGYALAALVVLVVGAKWMTRGAPAAPSTAAPKVAVRPPAPRAAVVQVVGAVRQPGVYRVRETLRVEAAVARAGGMTAKADASGVNLAAKVVDGAQIVIPKRGAAGTGGAVAAAGTAGTSDGAGAPAGPVNLNTATAEQLDGLDGIGPTTAGKIVEYRQQHGGFGSLRDLDRIPGIGPKRLAGLKGKVTP